MEFKRHIENLNKIETKEKQNVYPRDIKIELFMFIFVFSGFVIFNLHFWFYNFYFKCIYRQ